MSQKWDRKIVLTLNARNEHDRSKFVEDLRESVAEMDEMEALRLEAGNFKNMFIQNLRYSFQFQRNTNKYNLIQVVLKTDFLTRNPTGYVLK